MNRDGGLRCLGDYDVMNVHTSGWIVMNAIDSFHHDVCYLTLTPTSVTRSSSSRRGHIKTAQGNQNFFCSATNCFCIKNLTF